MSTLASLLVKLGLDASDFHKGVGEAESKASGLGKMLGTGLAVGAGVAAAAIGTVTAVLTDCVGEASAAEQAQAELNATLASTKGIAGVTAAAANDIATGLSEVTRFEDDAILKGENMLLTFTNIGKDVFPLATEAMLNMAQKMGGDASSQAVMLGKALNDPIAGLSALKRVGVAFTDSQEAMIKKMVESGNIAGAQKIILGELNTEFGGLARAAGQTAAGQMDIFNNKIGNMKEQVGTALLPALTQLMNVLGPPILSALQGVADFLSNSVVPAISDLCAWLQVNLPPAIQFLSDAWNTVLLPALTAIWQFIQTNVIPILSTVLTWLSVNLPPAIQFLADAWENVLRPALEAVWGFIETSVIPTLATVLDWLSVNLPPAIQFLADAWNNVLKPALTAIWNFLNTYIVPIFKALAEVEIAALKLAITALAGLWQNVLKPALEAVWNIISTQVIPVFESVAQTINEKVGPALSWLKDHIVDPLASAFDSVGDAISGVISWLENLAKKISSIQLPDWLTPGSPTPFELGLRGIADALEQVAQTDVPLFGQAPRLAYAGVRAGGVAGAGQITNHYAFNVTVHAPGGNAQTVAAATESGVLRAARALGVM